MVRTDLQDRSPEEAVTVASLIDRNPALVGLRRQYEEQGFLFLPKGEGLFSQATLQDVAQIVIGEMSHPAAHCGRDPTHKVEVLEIVNDRAGAVPADASDIAPVMRMILGNKEMAVAMTYIAGLPEADPLHFRRCQAHFMEEGSLIGLHTDTASNSCYKLALSIGLSENYSGGEFVVMHRDGEHHRFHLNENDVVILDPEVPHEVKEVTAGVRVTLPIFWGTHNGTNGRQLFPSAHAFLNRFEEY